MKYLLFVLLFSITLFAQGRDTLLFKLPNDTLAVKDTLIKKKYDVDTVIYSSASDSLIFFVEKRKMNLYGDGELQYRETNLKSANIVVDFETNNVDAQGVPSDSFPGKFKGTPILIDKGETYNGIRMKFNFKTNRGFISNAGSKMEGAFYTGDKIKKMDKDTYFIEDGIYTTCDEIPPHYYFYAHEMKVIQKQQISAKWVWLYFGGVPLPIPIPFAVFPIESGRRSGILPPTFGSDANYGNYLSRFGYFWAINDYMDVNLTADYYTRGSYDLNSRFRYAKRYDYSGNVEVGYSDRMLHESADPDRAQTVGWRIALNHNQTIDPTTRLDANLEFVSSASYLSQNVTNINELLQNNIVSNATLFKNWEEEGNSLSLSYSRNQNLQSGDINEILPNLTFSLGQKYPFRGKGVSTDQKWYEQIGYSYSGQFENRRIKTNGNLDIRGGFNHQFSTSFSPKIGYFNITPSFSYNERWYNKYVIEEYDKVQVTDSSGQIIPNNFIHVLNTKDAYKLNAVRTFSTGISAQTRFYGIFNPNAFGIASVRHTVIPSVSYNYTPDFGKTGWGYFSSYVDTNGLKQIYDKFQREVFGGASSGEQQNLSFSLSNILEMKTTVDPTDTTSKEKKIQLLNVSASMGYNFAADSMKLSDLNINYRTQVGDLLNLSGSTTFTPYDYTSTTDRINKFLVNEGKGLFRMTNLSFSLSTSISGDRLKSKETDAKKPEDKPLNELDNPDRQIYQGVYSQKEADFSIPWSLSLSYNYNLSQPSPLSVFKYSNLNGSIDFNLTPTWKFTVTGSYDFMNKQFAAPQIRISRDLHCWLMNFTWNPIGTYRGFNLEIKVKAPQLQDLKLTKRSDFYSGK
jgi:lipopolysaccharide assembly outer membrane protein LptD (OstA)